MKADIEVRMETSSADVRINGRVRVWMTLVVDDFSND